MQTDAPAFDPASMTQFIDALSGALAERSKAHNPYGQYGEAIGFRHDVSGAPITVGYSHGNGGNLSFPGVDPEVFHTVVGNRGILGQLPATGSVFANPTYQIITGVDDVTGSEKTDVCDDAPVAGLMRSGLVTSVFGRYERATQQIELNRLGQQNDRADPMDLRLVGSPISQTGVFTSGPGDPQVPADLLRREVSRKFWELGVAFHRQLSVQIWQGNPQNNTSGGGYKEITGLDLLIRTGYKDAVTGVALPSADSDVKDFAYADVADNGTDIVEALTYIYRTRKDLAERTSVMPVRWVYAMKQETFWELTAIWPCAYLTYRCNLTGIDGARVNIDGAEQVRMRDEMRAGKYLLIDGDRIEVVIDDGIAEQSHADEAAIPSGGFASSIYLIPMSITGGRAVTYLEYFQFSNPDITEALGNMALGRVEGPWITIPRQRNWCLQWQSKIEPRLVMRTPWLAGRLDNVVVSPLQRTRQPFPDDPYFVGGGVTSRPGPSYYQLWNS